MMQRTMLKVIAIEKPPQRKSLFRIYCKVNNKVCRVIVDFGSSDNVASREMVDKLKLVTNPHPYPYKVSWLKKEKQTLINEQVWVEFKIGEYKDKVLCDVVEMDACHLLLSRPWQYDVCAKHDGKTNVYTITKDGVEYNMPHLLDDGKPATNGVMLVGEKEFMKVNKEKDTPFFSFVVKPQKHPIEQ